MGSIPGLTYSTPHKMCYRYRYADAKIFLRTVQISEASRALVQSSTRVDAINYQSIKLYCYNYVIVTRILKIYKLLAGPNITH